MPLGAFINASQEKTACGGGRAMHMCTMGMSKKVPAPERISFVNASGPEKSPSSSGGSAGNDILLESLLAQVYDKQPNGIDLSLVLPKQPVFFVPEPVPKF